MGDPKKVKKKYSTPQHPWEGKRIEEENALKQEYGLKNKKEIWKANTTLRKVKSQAKRLIASETEQAKKEEKQLIERLVGLNLVTKDAKIDDILGLDIKKFLDRRLQTQVLKLGLARTPRQARQFIVHKHVTISGKIVNKPSYLVKKDEEGKISLNPLSALSKADHPEIMAGKKEEKARVIRPVKKVEKVEKPKEVVKPVEEKKE